MGKWAPAEFDRVCLEKIKRLFYASYAESTGVHDSRIETEFRGFIKALDVDNTAIKACFESLVKVQARLESKADRRQRRPETNYPLAYRHYDTSHARDETVNTTVAGASGSPSHVDGSRPFRDQEEGWETINFPSRVSDDEIWTHHRRVPLETTPDDWSIRGVDDTSATLAPRIPYADMFDPFDVERPHDRERNNGEAEPLPPVVPFHDPVDGGRPLFAPYDDLGPTPADEASYGNDIVEAVTRDVAVAVAAATSQHHVNTDSDGLFRLMTTYGNYDRAPEGIEGPARVDSPFTFNFDRNTVTQTLPNISDDMINRDPTQSPPSNRAVGSSRRGLGRFRYRRDARPATTITSGAMLDTAPPSLLRRPRPIHEVDSTSFDFEEEYRNVRRRTMLDSDNSVPAPNPTSHLRRLQRSPPPPSPRWDTRRHGIVWERVPVETPLGPLSGQEAEGSDAERA